MSNLQIFKSEKFGQVRTIEEGGKILFVASDVAKSLGYANPNKAVGDHCKSITKRYIPHPQSQNKEIEVNVIPEGDIYRLAAKSELPGAVEFESWVFDEVLPAIRKTGTYISPSVNEKFRQAELKAKLMRAEAMKINAQCRQFKMVKDSLKDMKLSPVAVEVFGLSTIETITGQKIQYRPQTEKTYTATELANELGISAKQLGTIANKLNIKNENYGIWVLDTAQHCKKEVQSFRYNEQGRLAILNYVKKGIKVIYKEG